MQHSITHFAIMFLCQTYRRFSLKAKNDVYVAVSK